MKILSATCLCLICLCASLSACSTAENNTEKSPTDITKLYFEAFETADYETMKSYCTEDCIEKYFHDNDVFGSVWEKAINIEDPVELGDSKHNVFVTVEMETAETSALYPATETSYYVVFIQLDDGSWLIDGFVTG